APPGRGAPIWLDMLRFGTADAHGRPHVTQSRLSTRKYEAVVVQGPVTCGVPIEDHCCKCNAIHLSRNHSEIRPADGGPVFRKDLRHLIGERDAADAAFEPDFYPAGA